ncbi:unnamed protein product [Adineta steineri]|uniref:Meckelin n=5 Tax=Adineta steineri TaxID=433720 RepID=A0A818MUS7_9BILA|nr:unnamed protein product [Adineta steineri]CAF3595036.1 unnamed protein product [Adineta steineri]
MILYKSFPYLFLPLISLTIISAQTSLYTAYQTSFPYNTTCSTNQYFDVALLQCSPCPQNAQQKVNDPTQCDCVNNSYYYDVNQGGGSLSCILCSSTYTRSSDGFGCIASAVTCNSTISNAVLTESDIIGNQIGTLSSSSSQPRLGGEICTTCQGATWPDVAGQRCMPCASVTPRKDNGTTISCCTANSTDDGVCLTYVTDTVTFASGYLNTFSSSVLSTFIQQHLKASFYLCRMNLNSTATMAQTRILLTNATACQVLANIAAMQFYYDSSGYAYTYYNTYIWNPADTPAIWTTSTVRPSIPFLAYPDSYYSEITSSTYNWIPATFNTNDLITFKLAKYSPTGQFIGLVDAIDTYIQLCGGGYTDGRAAFTFGTQYTKSCNIRVDALWNSSLYETAFYDPYIVFTKSGVDNMLPGSVVIKNYKTASGSLPNQGSIESAWTYHRRFFLLDRISGVTTGGQLTSVRYAKTITILNTLSDGGSYIQPPAVVVEYGELSLSDFGTGKVVQVSFQSTYRMNLDTHIRDIWIAVGVLAGIGALFAFVLTSVWQPRAGKDFIDLGTIGKLFLYICKILATVFFIVMAGVSLWWLIFFKRQDAIYLVLPTSIQQISFTVLVVVAFVLKTIDILHLIIYQAYMDIFFIDWEKPKAGNGNTVSVWRTYFAANEFHEIQTFRRINLTFQIFFVLFLLKVINLENVATAQPGVSLFPSDTDYHPGYNGILRVGIAFSMWLATALIQYVVYVIFYQRFFEDRLLNFIDLCSVSNISVFILIDRNYGYYIHGRSPHGTTDVNMKDMLINLERESNQMSGTRGLQAKANDQTFIILIDHIFRAQYDLLLQNYQEHMRTRTIKKSAENSLDVLMKSYKNLNEFLCSFIDHALPSHNYIVRDRTFIEKLLNYEFQQAIPSVLQGESRNVFLVDEDKNFSNVMFSGHENSLLIWNMATFLFIDYFAFNYVLAAIITYILNFIAVKIRLALGRKNLSTKSSVPKDFLI